MSRVRVVVKMITVTIRIIKSFEYRNFKNIILHIDPLMTVQELKVEIMKKLPKGLNNINYDTLKIYVKAHGSKTSNLIINLDNQDMLDDSKTLESQGKF